MLGTFPILRSALNRKRDIGGQTIHFLNHCQRFYFKWESIGLTTWGWEAKRCSRRNKWTSRGHNYSFSINLLSGRQYYNNFNASFYLALHNLFTFNEQTAKSNEKSGVCRAPTRASRVPNLNLFHDTHRSCYLWGCYIVAVSETRYCLFSRSLPFLSTFITWWTLSRHGWKRILIQLNESCEWRGGMQAMRCTFRCKLSQCLLSL